MVLPLRMRSDGLAPGTKLLGRLCVCGMDDSEDRALLQYKGTLIRNILEANLTNATLHEELKRSASIDSLTGVGTRMPFERRLEEECARAARYNRPFCLAMVDVDNFKSINDNLGHAGGDRALTMVAVCMANTKRTIDVLARYGGDEFVLLLPETELESGFLVVERIRKQIGGMLVAEGIAMTISCGVVDNCSCPGTNANELLRRADMALYRAKEAGRNRTESWANLSRDPSAISEEEGQEIVELREKLADISTQAKDAFIQSIGGFVKALDARDPYTKLHSENTMRYAVSIAEALGLADEEVAVIRRAAVIHDLGKIGVRDSVLLCPGKLTPNELRIMQQHPVIAGRILDQMRFLERELPIVRHHHERWDGQGYPDGLAGTAIPLGARILAVADSFDAITSTRVYRDAKSVPEALRILADNAGTQFDQAIVESMLQWADKVHRQIGRDKPLMPSDLLDVQMECVLGA
jgi:diguanylate cyclase (GGDEF)-like protein